MPNMSIFTYPSKIVVFTSLVSIAIKKIIATIQTVHII